MDLKKLFERAFNFKNSKKAMMNLVILLICGVLLILVGDIVSNMNAKKDGDVKNSVEVTTNAKTAGLPGGASSYDDRIKKELQETLSQIAGVGKVNVIIYFDGGVESIPAKNISDVNKKTEEKDGQNGTRITTETSKTENIVVTNEGGASKPFIVKQLNPSIGGVMVVAEGADNSGVKESLQNAVRTVLNLPVHKVSVMPMKRN